MPSTPKSKAGSNVAQLSMCDSCESYSSPKRAQLTPQHMDSDNCCLTKTICNPSANLDLVRLTALDAFINDKVCIMLLGITSMGNTSERNNVVFLNPAAMALCGIQFCQPVLCQFVGEKGTSMHVVLTVWPSDSVDQLSCSVSIGYPLAKPVNVAKSFKRCLIRKTTQINACAEIYISPCSNDMQHMLSREEFSNYLHDVLTNSWVTEKQSLIVRYFAHQIELAVERIIIAQPPATPPFTYDLDDNITNALNKTTNGIDALALDSPNCEPFSTPKHQVAAGDVETGSQWNRSSGVCSTGLDVFQLTKSTKFVVLDSAHRQNMSRRLPHSLGHVDNKITGYGDTILLDSVGGMSLLKQELMKLVIYPLRQAKLGIGLSILLTGSCGGGKTTLCRALINELSQYAVNVTFLDLQGFQSPDSWEYLQRQSSETPQDGARLVVVDDLDMLISKDAAGGPNPKTKQLLSFMHNMANNWGLGDTIATHDSKTGKQVGACPIILVATVTEASKLSPRIRRCFELEFDIPTPNSTDRLEILQKLLNKYSKMNDQHDDNRGVGVDATWTATDLTPVAEQTPGYSPSDLVALVRNFVRQLTSSDRVEEKSGSSVAQQKSAPGGLARVDRTQKLLEASRSIRPSALREVILELPRVSWNSIGGQTLVKRSLRQVIELPLQHPQLFAEMGVTPPTGVLLYGPPGCSKTMIARALASEARLTFLTVKGPELFNKWVGESERGVRELFAKARRSAPSLIFFDEVDALGSARDSDASQKSQSSVAERVLAQLLTELDGIEPLSQVIVIAATNRPDIIDPALLRPGRLDRLVFVDLPDSESRAEIVRLSLNNILLADVAMGLTSNGSGSATDISETMTSPSNSDRLQRIVDDTDGFSGAEVVALCREATLAAIQRYTDSFSSNNLPSEKLSAKDCKITWADFELAFKSVRPRTDPKQMDMFRKFQVGGTNC